MRTDRPYIGVIGITDSLQMDRAVEYIDDDKRDPHRDCSTGGAPHLSQLAEYQRIMKDEVRMIVQIGPTIIDTYKGNPRALALKIRGYRDVATDILIDPSNGRGIPLDPNLANTLLDEIVSLVPGMGIGVAGSLGPEGLLETIGPIVKRHPNVSFSARTRLRDEKDFLDYQKMAAFLTDGFSV